MKYFLISNNFKLSYKELKLFLHTPGIEPGATAWKAVMLPLHHACSTTTVRFELTRTLFTSYMQNI